MSATILFNPVAGLVPPFSALLTLDKISCTLSTHWNSYSQRWYYSITDTGGNLLIKAALIGSPPTQIIPLAPGIFQTSVITFDSVNNLFRVTP